MKRKYMTLGVLLVMFGVAAAMNGCTTTARSAPSPSQAPSYETEAAATSGTSPFESMVSEFTHTVSYPEIYRITYDVQNPDGTISTVSKAVDSSGTVYFQSGVAQSMFIFDGGTYTQYVPDSNGSFMQSTGGTTCNAQYVVDFTKEFTEYAETSGQLKMPTATYIGEAQIADRECDIYEISAGFANFVKIYQLSVDKETGICLGWSEETRVGSNSYDADGAVFTCTEFQTDHISLPSVK